MTRAYEALDVDGRTLRVSNLDRVLWPSVGFTKAHLLEYYRAIASALLPHARERPMTLARFPEGVEAEGWYQMNVRGGPAWLRTVGIQTQTGQTLHYSVLDDPASLLWAANQGTLEFHPYLARVSTPLHPHALVVDLDPGAPAGVVEAARVAQLARELLEEDGLRCFVKSSGRRGLHLYVPVNGKATYVQTRAYAKALAQELYARRPDAIVLSSAREKRAGKVFIDWQQNHPARSTVAPYSLRAGSFPVVSTPLTWDEVAAAADGRTPGRLVFGPGAALERLGLHGELFAPVVELQQALPG